MATGRFQARATDEVSIASLRQSTRALAVYRRNTDRFGIWARLAVLLDGRTVGKLRRGQSLMLDADPGLHEVRVRMLGISSDPVTVTAVSGRTTVVSFAMENPRREAKVGPQALAYRLRGLWGARVELPDEGHPVA